MKMIFTKTNANSSLSARLVFTFANTKLLPVVGTEKNKTYY